MGNTKKTHNTKPANSPEGQESATREQRHARDGAAASGLRPTKENFRLMLDNLNVEEQVLNFLLRRTKDEQSIIQKWLIEEEEPAAAQGAAADQDAILTPSPVVESVSEMLDKVKKP